MRFGEPFVLLDDARPGGKARLYTDPVRIVEANSLADVPPALDALRAARAEGLHASGYLTYEAGGAFEPRADIAAPLARPLLWFGLFDSYRAIDSTDVPTLLPDPAGAWAGEPRPCISRADYLAQFARVSEYIAAGDIYQANLSFRAEVPFAGHPAALYALLRARSLAGFGALVFTGSRWLLSLSPELFFQLDGRQLTARPMKGTVPRAADSAADVTAATWLRDDPKQRAENLMIVDLLRNDMSRVAVPGSVKVPALFSVESYPTVHTMTSTITATLTHDKDAVDAITALFPCGSITGAPKIRAMQVIAEVEHGPRNTYTGSIGRLDPDGGAAFNVAIRTLDIADGANTALLGLGGGIVADSQGDSEWEECRTKGRFVTAKETPFDLIETMAFDPVDGIALLERHLARMRESAAALGFAFDRHSARNELQAATFRLRRPARVRLLLAASGAVSIGIAPLPVGGAGPLAVALVPHQVARDDFRLRHKTTRRGFYDDARRVAGTDEVVFVDGDGFVTEGSFTNVFVERDGVLVTPPLARGLLPGVLRAELLATGRAVEVDLRRQDLLGGFLLGNALRGLMPAVIAQPTPVTL